MMKKRWGGKIQLFAFSAILAGTMTFSAKAEEADNKETQVNIVQESIESENETSGNFEGGRAKLSRKQNQSQWDQPQERQRRQLSQI